MDDNEKSSIMPTSNIILKSKYEKKDGRYYIPFDMLPDLYKDVRTDPWLSEQQRKQNMKRLFAASQIIDKDDE